MSQQERKLETVITKPMTLDYLLHVPKDYDPTGDKKWPFILFLHGAGERGDGDLQLVKKHGIPKIVEQNGDFPFIVASPQCPSSSFWSIEKEALKALIDEIVSSYRVDRDRIYLTGLSMGGYGTWDMATSYPQLFAAAAPICGGGYPWLVNLMKEVPTWVFHGDTDSVVPLEESQKMVRALEQCGGNVRFTVYPGVDHNSWTETYENPELYDWFMQHRKNDSALE